MNYEMSDDEIRVSYNTAKRKPDQVKVLAELNAVTVPKMRQKLLELGCDMQASTKARKPSVQSSRGPRKAPVDEARAMELYHAGKSDLDMAEMLGVSIYRVRQWRYDNNLMRECGAAAHKSRRGGTSACRAEPPTPPEAETPCAAQVAQDEPAVKSNLQDNTMSTEVLGRALLELSRCSEQLTVSVNGAPAKAVRISVQLAVGQQSQLHMEVII